MRCSSSPAASRSRRSPIASTIGFAAFADRVIAYFPPRSNRAHTWDVLEQLWSLDVASSRTLVAPVARMLVGRLKQTSLICLVSDFLTPEDLGNTPDVKMLAARHDVVSVVVEDPLEASLPEGAAPYGCAIWNRAGPRGWR